MKKIANNTCSLLFIYYLCTRKSENRIAASRKRDAQMAESVDALVSNTSGAIHPGSIPGLGTKKRRKQILSSLFFIQRSHNMESASGKYKCISGSTLKLIAVFAMLLDHSAKALYRYVPALQTEFFTIGDNHISTAFLMTSIGRMAFPIFAFLIVEGFIHTHNRMNYGRNLLLFALISEIPWNLIHTNSILCPRQNVFFTLFFGYLGICVIEKYKGQLKEQALYLILLFLVSVFLRADYGCQGFAFILMLYLLRNKLLLAAIVGSGFLSSTWRAGLAFIPICLYNGKRGFVKGRVLKYAFYLFYPVHLMVLYFVRSMFL